MNGFSNQITQEVIFTTEYPPWPPTSPRRIPMPWKRSPRRRRRGRSAAILPTPSARWAAAAVGADAVDTGPVAAAVAAAAADGGRDERASCAAASPRWS